MAKEVPNSLLNTYYNSSGFEISHISKLDGVWSPEYIVQGIPWNVLVCKKQVEGKQYLAICLYCAKKDKPVHWTHAAFATFKLLSFNVNVNAFEKNSEPNVFDHSGVGFGFPTFIEWDSLFDGKNNYVMDDTIRFDVKIEAEPQNQINRSSLIFEILEKCCSDTGLATFRLLIFNIENLMAVRSPEFVLRGFPWDLTVYKTRSSELSVRLRPKRSPRETSYKTKMTVKLLSKRADVEPIERTQSENIRQSTTTIATNQFVSWDELFKPENGFIENTAIMLEIDIDASKPLGNINSGASGSNIESKRQKLQCVICFEDISSQNVSCTPCGHTFCTACITKVIGLQKTCPSCRAKLTLESLRRVHLPFMNEDYF